MLGWCSTRFIALSSTEVFQAPTMLFQPKTSICNRYSPRSGPLSWFLLYPTLPDCGSPRHRDASRREGVHDFHADIDFLISVRWNWYSSSPESIPNPLESLKKHFLPDRSSPTCPWNGTAPLTEDLVVVRGLFWSIRRFEKVVIEI